MVRLLAREDRVALSTALNPGPGDNDFYNVGMGLLCQTAVVALSDTAITTMV